MMTWLMRLHPAPPVLDGLLTFQITGSPIPALIAFTAPMLRGRISLLSRDH
ncbi:hypothetical protein ACX40Y_17130 [Sphingomonas sp. RS6]